MKTNERSTSSPVRRVLLWSVSIGGLAGLVALITGFAGMAHKQACLPLATHCAGDPIQDTLIVVYFGALTILAACVALGLVAGIAMAVEALYHRRAAGAAPGR